MNLVQEALTKAESNVQALRAELHTLERLVRERTEQLYHEIGAVSAFKAVLETMKEDN